MLGGISGYRVTETTDEDPQRVADVQELTTAYLRSALFAGDPAWSKTSRPWAENASPRGRVEEK
jgi:hypothetical protein